MYALFAGFRKNPELDTIYALDIKLDQADIEVMDNLKYFFESVFLIDMVSQFFLEYKHD